MAMRVDKARQQRLTFEVYDLHPIAGQSANFHFITNGHDGLAGNRQCLGYNVLTIDRDDRPAQIDPFNIGNISHCRVPPFRQMATRAVPHQHGRSLRLPDRCRRRHRRRLR